MLAHTVYFALRDNSEQARKSFIAACKRHLSGHPGMLLFAVSVLAADIDSPVNDRRFDVAVHLVFSNKAAHDQYQESPRHLQFLEENEGCWREVRAFDSYVDSVAAAMDSVAATGAC